MGLNVPNDWPPSSPDLNPIENVWGRMETELAKISPKTIDNLTKGLKSLWRRILTPEYCQTLVMSMKERLKQVIDRQGKKASF